VETGAGGDVFERTVAAVVVEARALAAVGVGRAVRLVATVERAEKVLLRRPVDVVADEQVEQAIAVIVEEGGAGGES
jgi:hypothetical protein